MKTQYTFNGTLNNLKERIHGWLYSTELEHIVQAFHGSFPHMSSTAEQAKWLLSFSDRWDYRSIQ